MPLIRISKSKDKTTKFNTLEYCNKKNAKESLKDIINFSGAGVQSGCVGNGACGLCIVKIIKGDINAPERIEVSQLGEEKINSGYRLACRVFPKNDLEIEIVNPVTKPKWTRLINNKKYLSNNSLKPLSMGIAIDLGTTFISISAFNCHAESPELITTCVGLNPQIKYGSDVIARLIFANKSPDFAHELFNLVVIAIQDALVEITKTTGVTTEKITKLVIAGNTAMLTLLTKSSYSQLLNPKNWISKIECDYSITKVLKTKWGLQDNAKIEIIPPIAGFIGSDLTAGIISTNLMSKDNVAMLIDFGTNSEMALWNGEQLWVTSAACGPAFELSGVTCGMPALPGAIYKVSVDSNNDMHYHTISNIAPKGFCGSGLIDIIALLLKNNIINNRGSFNDKNIPFFKLPGTHDIKIYKKDIDTVQKGKAAIATGYTVLLEKAKCSVKNIKKIYVGGAFGNHLNVKNAQTIGLLPKINSDLIEIRNNTSLAGCEHMLLNNSKIAKFKRIEAITNVVNLSNHDNFEELYMQNLFLQ